MGESHRTIIIGDAHILQTLMWYRLDFYIGDWVVTMINGTVPKSGAWPGYERSADLCTRYLTSQELNNPAAGRCSPGGERW